MEKLEKFVSLLTGHFDNREQFGVMKDAGTEFPYAEHVNTKPSQGLRGSVCCGGKLL